MYNPLIFNIVIALIIHSIGGIILKLKKFRYYSKIIYMRLITTILACITVYFIYVD